MCVGHHHAFWKQSLCLQWVWRVAQESFTAGRRFGVSVEKLCVTESRTVEMEKMNSTVVGWSCPSLPDFKHKIKIFTLCIVLIHVTVNDACHSKEKTFCHQPIYKQIFQVRPQMLTTDSMWSVHVLTDPHLSLSLSRSQCVWVAEALCCRCSAGARGGLCALKAGILTWAP